MLRKNGITVREKIGKSGRVNFYYGVGKHEFWYKKLDPFLSRENLELKFKERREKQQAEKAQPRTSPWQLQPQTQPKPQPKPIVIPPLPDVVCGVKIDRLRQQAYQEGKFISIGLCEPGSVVPLTHWIWYDFDKREPVISQAYPSDHKIPEAFQQQLATKQSSASSSPSAGIRLSTPSIDSAPIRDEGFTHGAALPEDFKLWLSRHPGLTLDEARSRYREEQKAKQRRTGQKLH